MTFRAERGEDLWLCEQGLIEKSGTYVDCGCSDPYEGSNTAFLRDLGWKGLCIDAQDYMEAWKATNATFEQMVVSEKRDVKFMLGYGALARIHEWGQAVVAAPLEDILVRHNIGKIDFMNLDLEGGEFDAWNTMEFELHRPTIVIAEYLTMNLDRQAATADYRMKELLPTLGYQIIHDSGNNLIFKL
jgi:hypothetical protein